MGIVPQLPAMTSRPLFVTLLMSKLVRQGEKIFSLRAKKVINLNVLEIRVGKIASGSQCGALSYAIASLYNVRAEIIS